MLTDKAIRAMKPRATLYRVRGGDGLCIEITPAGSKLWRFRYRYGGKANMLALGEWPHVTIAEARERRDEARRQLAHGIDPGAARKAVRDAEKLTFEAIAREWMARRDVAPATAEKDAWLLEHHALPVLGAKPISTISAADVLALLQGLEDRGLLETARRLRSKISAVFRHARATLRTTNDPTADLRGAIKTPTVTHHAAVTDPRKLGELLRALHSYSGSYVVSCALKLAPLLFVRPGELRHAEWVEIDLDAATWSIPAAKMKMRAPHIVPLSRQAVTILRELYALTGRGQYVFTGQRHARSPMSEAAVSHGLRALGYDGRTMSGHGFRSTASTLLHELGYPPHVIEAQLAHAQRNQVAAAYNRASYLPERIKMMQHWADYLDGLRQGADVVPIRGRR